MPCSQTRCTMSKHIERFTIPSYLTDGDRMLSPNSLLSVTQELGLVGAEELGCGETEMARHGVAWVYSRIRFTVLRYPVLGEKLVMETWHNGQNGPFFIRNYRLLSEDGTLLVKASSSSVVLDTATRTVKRVEQLEMDLSPQDTETVYDEPAGKVMMPRGVEPDAVYTRRVEYCDTDFVGHTNNTNYLRWALDLECRCEDALKHPSDVSLCFMHEARLGDEIQYRRYVLGDERFYAGFVGDKQVIAIHMYR